MIFNELLSLLLLLLLLFGVLYNGVSTFDLLNFKISNYHFGVHGKKS